MWASKSRSILIIRTGIGLSLVWCRTIYSDVIMSATASQITSLAIVYSIVYSGIDQSKHQSPASLAFVRGIHRSPVNFPNKRPVTRKLIPFDDIIMPFISWTRDDVLAVGPLGTKLTISFVMFNLNISSAKCLLFCAGHVLKITSDQCNLAL